MTSFSISYHSFSADGQAPSPSPPRLAVPHPVHAPFVIKKHTCPNISLGQVWNEHICGTTRLRVLCGHALSPRTIMHAPRITGGAPVAPTCRMTAFGLPSQAHSDRRCRRDPTIRGSLCTTCPLSYLLLFIGLFTRIGVPTSCFLLSIAPRSRFVNTFLLLRGKKSKTPSFPSAQRYDRQRIRPALPAPFGPADRGRSHMRIKADGLRVLLVDRDLTHAVRPDAVAQQRPADALAPCCRDMKCISGRPSSAPIKAAGAPCSSAATVSRSTAVMACGTPPRIRRISASGKNRGVARTDPSQTVSGASVSAALLSVISTVFTLFLLFPAQNLRRGRISAIL